MFQKNLTIFNLIVLFFFFKFVNDFGNILVSGLMSNGEGKTQASVLIDRATSVLAAHSTNWGKTC